MATATRTRRAGPDARRITYYRDRSGDWRYKVQGYNWKTIDSDEGFKNLSYAQRKARRKWGNDIEEIINR